MSYQVLARKWRPADFGQMVGQEHVVQALVNALGDERLHHAYLFSGTRGVGKTTLGRIFAKALNCERGVSAEPCNTCASCVEIDEGRSVDLLEIDAASRTGVDDMRELLDNVQYAPTRGRYKIYLIDEVHMLSKHSFNALLKTLEEPPPHVKFLLATTDPQKVPVTVLSRCLQFSLKRMSRAQIRGQLQRLVDAEEVTAEPAALAQLAAAADGSMRDALSLLDQAIAYGAGEVSGAVVEAMLGTISRDYLERLFDALVARDAAALIGEARTVIEHNPDYQRVCAEMLALLQQLALYKQDPALADEEIFAAEMLGRYAAGWSAEEIQLNYQILLQGRQDLLLAPDVAAGFEMLMLRLLAFAPAAVAASAEKKKPELKGPRTEGGESVPTEESAGAIGDWSTLAYELDLGGLARQIVANSLVVDQDAERLELGLLPEIHDLLTRSLEAEIGQALEQRLGVSLRLEFRALSELETSTPVEARDRRLDDERSAIIAAIRDDKVVRKLGRALAAELDESSVVKLDDRD